MIPLDTADTALIRVPILIYDASGNLAEGATASGAELQISKAGGAMTNATGTLVELGGGSYYYQGVVADADTQGVLLVKYEKSLFLTSFGGSDVVPEVTVDTSAIADAVWDEVMENSKTARQWMRGFKAALWGKSTKTTISRTFRDDADTKERIEATVDDSGRTSIVEDLD
jgi:hypothetical protein